ncbi:MAG: HAD family hydrolase [Acidobacteria bacterium]|nr:HAD family hydrolase [Acidobacteriota bacterium]
MTRCLIFDADDTLWENNLYFEQAIEEFLDLIAPLAGDRARVRSLLCEVERECIPQGGYGTRNFLHALRQTFHRLYTGRDGHGYLAAIERIGERLFRHPIQPRPGVADTLQILQPRHRLLLFTKGDPQEQSDKLERSGLENFFEAAEIVPEKDVPAYRGLIFRYGLDPASTFMIGNSPRSDVLPALEAGLWAVFIPHPHTWELEHQEIPTHSRLLRLSSIQELPALVFP